MQGDQHLPAFFRLLRFNLFFHINELLLGIVEFVLQECEFLRRNDVHTSSVFQLPPPFLRDKALIDVGGNVGMDVQIEFLDADLIDEGVNFAL